MFKIEEWEIGKLIPYINNPRVNEHAVETVASAIKEFGFRVPIVAKSDGIIIDGHLRYKSAKKLGLKKVPVILADDMSDTQIKAFRISVNKVSELADWDEELLKLEIEDLQEMNFNLDLLGFNSEELEALDLDEFNEEASNKIKEEEYFEKIELVIEFETESEQEKLYEELLERGFKCHVQSL